MAINRIEHTHEFYELKLVDEELRSRERAQESLHEFARQAWHQLEGPQRPFIDGWHIQALCDHLEAVTRRDIRNLIVNVPPRCMKSSLLSILWPAWMWSSNPSEQFLYASYGAFLSIRDSFRCRALIESKWYQERWGHIFVLSSDQNTKSRFYNSENGYRITSSILGASTGEGGDFVVWDDPNNAKDGESEIKRQRINDAWSGSWSNRLNDFKRSCRVISQQRLHEMDASGYIMKGDDENEWVRLILPMEFESKRRSKTIILPSTHGKVWVDPRKAEGDLIWPERIGEKELRSLKSGLASEYRIAGQLQQRPSPESGGLIKKSWFSWWKNPRPPKVLQVIQSWDTAFTDERKAKDNDSYSACTTWGVFNDENNIANIILLSLWRGKVGYPELRRMAKKLYSDYRDDGKSEIKSDGNHVPDVVLVESKASGISLIQDMRRAGIAATSFNPSRYGDKTQRVRRITHHIEGGRVWVPARAPDYTRLRQFSEVLVEMCAMFPNGESRDVVDTMTQVILRLVGSGWLMHPDDIKDDGEPSRQTQELYW